MQELIIIGAGPAGLSASVYASRYGIIHSVVGEITGGLTTETHEIGNWLGEKSIAGYEFAAKAEAHAKSLGAEFVSGRVVSIEKKDRGFELALSGGKKLKSETVLLATGTKHKKLGISGEEEFKGKGVSYCATCDGFFYKEKIVAVVGGSNSAAAAAIHLSGIVNKVYIVYRRDKLRAEKYWTDAIAKKQNIEVIYSANVKEIEGEALVSGLVLDTKYKGSDKLGLNGVFIEIGLDPNTELAQKLGIELDEDNYIRVSKSNATSLKGVWAAGDTTDGSNKFMQIVTAASEGAVAAGEIQKYLKAKR